MTDEFERSIADVATRHVTQLSDIPSPPPLRTPMSQAPPPPQLRVQMSQAPVFEDRSLRRLAALQAVEMVMRQAKRTEFTAFDVDAICMIQDLLERVAVGG